MRDISKSHTKHIFLEGPIQQGKSTLIRKVLAPYKDYVGGFASQRLNLPDGTTMAYRIGPAAQTPLTAPFNDDVKGGHNGVFRINTPSGMALKFPEVFDCCGIDYLKNNDGKKIILLDEIGGAEMLNDDFSKELYQLLSGDIPCIGVIKRYKSAGFMSKTAGYSKEISSKNLALRTRLTEELNGKIIEFKRNDHEVEQILEDFLCGIFMTR